jgi:hypothetical protein
VGAQFYPFYAITKNGGNDDFNDDRENCTLVFGNFTNRDFNTFGGDAQYGASNLYWFFGQNSSGPRTNPCIPHPKGEGERTIASTLIFCTASEYLCLQSYSSRLKADHKRLAAGLPPDCRRHRNRGSA